jgi:formate dehydrogenase major subunit
MTSFTITIDGQEVEARAGQTVLEAAKAAGIDIPSLCHHPALKPIGACRVCLVEIAGQRSLQPACTFPVSARMEIQTESEKVVAARKFVLELIFSERNHFCMYCEMSGNCELQNLGYRYGLDHFLYPTYSQRFAVDATPAHFLIDHNRCVLCRRCIRACSELSANHTLDLSRRGAMTMVSADMNEAMGKSSCISCGTCLDVCPTGALVDKRSAFMRRKGESEAVESICTQCSLGCGIELIVQNGQVLRVQSRWGSPVSGGLLCEKGRFLALTDGRPRIASPMVREKGGLVPATWKAALQAASAKIRLADPARIGVLTASDATNEALGFVKRLFCQRLEARHSSVLGPLGPSVPAAPPDSLLDMEKSDCILVFGADPASTHPVAASFIKRAVDKGARLILVNKRETKLSAFADAVFTLEEAEKAVAASERSEKPVILCGEDCSPEAVHALEKLNGKAKWIPLQSGVNSGTAVSLGLNGAFRASDLDLLYVISGDAVLDASPILSGLPKKSSIIVQAVYRSDLTDRAEVVLPAAPWLERSGTFTNTFGLTQIARGARKAQGEARADWEILQMLAGNFGIQTQAVPDGLAPSEIAKKENPS